MYQSVEYSQFLATLLYVSEVGGLFHGVSDLERVKDCSVPRPKRQDIATGASVTTSTLSLRSSLYTQIDPQRDRVIMKQRDCVPSLKTRMFAHLLPFAPCLCHCGTQIAKVGTKERGLNLERQDDAQGLSCVAISRVKRLPAIMLGLL
jgi:hypothetical protein